MVYALNAFVAQWGLYEMREKETRGGPHLLKFCLNTKATALMAKTLGF